MKRKEGSEVGDDVDDNGSDDNDNNSWVRRDFTADVPRHNEVDGIHLVRVRMRIRSGAIVWRICDFVVVIVGGHQIMMVIIKSGFNQKWKRR